MRERLCLKKAADADEAQLLSHRHYQAKNGPTFTRRRSQLATKCRPAPGRSAEMAPTPSASIGEGVARIMAGWPLGCSRVLIYEN